METIDFGTQVLRQFEADWRLGKAHDLQRYLPPADDPRFEQVLEDLVKLELELAWTGGLGTSDILAQRITAFPQLDRRHIVLRLVQREFDVRSRLHLGVTAEEYVTKFPQWNFIEREIVDRVAATTDAIKGDSSRHDKPAAPDNGAMRSSVLHDLDASLGSRRYTLSRLHAEGGLGRVWLAHDGDLNREVALKQLQPRFDGREDACRRFLKEAQITGQLEHPNIVPVYELGRSTDDAPFYTMRFVRGQTLAEAIAAFHRDRRPGYDSPLERQTLLQAFVAVAHAVAYAHSRGIIHRDLKPENILLGQFGEVLLLDWGLAKLRGEPDVLGSVALSGDASAELTHVGHVLGTPAYMAPEQAEGRIDAIDARTDIYGLGAILFEILAGKPPHSGGDTARVLERIASEPTPQARWIEPSVPAALDAICARAMAKRPEDRYRDAPQLIADVQRWLADEPVSVYRDGLGAKTTRWLRKHRTGALAAAASLVAITLVSTTALAVVHRQQRLTEAARQHAEVDLAAAQDAVDRILTRVSGDRLAALPKNEPIRRDMLDVAMIFCQKLLTENPTDPGVRWRTGRAHRQVAGIYQVLDKPELAESEYHASIAMLSKLSSDVPGELDYQRDLAGSYNNFGNFLEAHGRSDEAEVDYRQAIAIFAKIATADRDDPDYRLQLAAAHNNLGVLLLSQGKAKEAEAEHRAALTIQEALVKASPDSREFAQALAACRNDLGVLYRGTGRLPEAEASYLAALALYSRLADAHAGNSEQPDNPESRSFAAQAENNLAAVQSAEKKLDTADTSYASAVDRFEKLVADYPTVPDYRFKLASCETNRALFLLPQGRTELARTALNRALALYEQPGPTPPAADYAVPLHTLGMLTFDDGKLDDAKKLVDHALALRRELAKNAPQNVSLQTQLALSLQAAGDIATAQKRLDDAIDLYTQAIAVIGPIAERPDASWAARTMLQQLRTSLGEATQK